MQKQLPIAEPIITSFPGYANALSILLAYPHTLDWVYSHYIQINTAECIDRYSGAPETELLFFVDCDWDKNTTTWSGELLFGSYLCPYLRCYSLPSELLMTHIDNFSSFVRESIDHNMYVKTFLDVSNIDAYQPVRDDFSHDAFIHGYDDTGVYFSDFLNKHGGQYSEDKVYNSELGIAYSSIVNKEAIEQKKEHSVVLIKVVEDLHIPLDEDFVRESIRRYLFPVPSESQNLYHHLSRLSVLRKNKIQKVYQGVDVYNYLSDYVKKSIDFGHLDVRLFHAMYDHKKMMVSRMNYFIEKGMIPENKRHLIDQYESVMNSSLLIRNSIIKWNLSHYENICSSVDSKFNLIKEMELDLLTKFFLER